MLFSKYFRFSDSFPDLPPLLIKVQENPKNHLLNAPTQIIPKIDDRNITFGRIFVARQTIKIHSKINIFK